MADDEHECDDLNPSLAASGEEKKSEGVSLKDQIIAKYHSTELANIKEFPMFSMGIHGWAVSLEVRFKQSTTGLKAVKREVENIEKLRKNIDVSLYGAPITVEYGGGLSAMKSEYDAIVADIARSISVTILSILVLIGLFSVRCVRLCASLFLWS